VTLHRHARDQCRCQGPACVAASEVAALGRCGTLPNRPDWDHERWLVTASSSGRGRLPKTGWACYPPLSPQLCALQKQAPRGRSQGGARGHVEPGKRRAWRPSARPILASAGRILDDPSAALAARKDQATGGPGGQQSPGRRGAQTCSGNDPRADRISGSRLSISAGPRGGTCRFTSTGARIAVAR